MKKLVGVIFLLSVLTSCGYHVKEHTKLVYVVEGYECVNGLQSALKICKTIEECNEYCDKLNNK